MEKYTCFICTIVIWLSLRGWTLKQLFIKHIFCIRNKSVEVLILHQILSNWQLWLLIHSRWKMKAQKYVVIIIISIVVRSFQKTLKTKQSKQTNNCPCSLYLISPIYKLLPACPFTLSKNAPCIKTADVCQIESANPILIVLQSLSSHLKCKEVLN